MLYLAFTVSVYFTFFILIYKKFLFESHTPLHLKQVRYMQIVIILFSLVFRFILAMHTKGYETDMNCWRAWADRAFSFGPWGFYSEDFFCDYPPGYMYILTVIGFIRHIFPALPPTLELALLKAPAILFDIILINVFAKRVQNTDLIHVSLGPVLLFAFSPAIWVNSSVWGQVDSVFMLFFILSLLSLTDKKYYKSAFWLGISIVFKPQALLFAPIYVLAVTSNRREKKIAKKFFCAIVICISTIFLISFPFIIQKSPFFIFNLYLKTISSYKYASLNAFNLFTLLGANGMPLNETLYGLAYGTWGIIGICFAFTIGSGLFLQGKDDSKYFYISAIILFGVFMLGSKMHERYLFPAIILFFFAYIYQKDRRILFLAIALSLLHFMNVGYLYTLSLSGTYYAMAPNKTASVLSFLHLLIYLYSVYLGFTLYFEKKYLDIKIPVKLLHFIKNERFIVWGVTLMYALLAFSNLGNFSAPKTAASVDNIADFGLKKAIESVSVYKGIGECNLYFEFSDDAISWSTPVVFEGSDCFKWKNYSLSAYCRYVRIRFTGQSDCIYEAAFWDNTGAQIPITNESTLFDEQHLCEKNETYLNSTYFDEIYHARTAYEHIEYIPHYETTHPPLGKLIIGLGIRLFGMNPFGWRCIGTLVGVLMLPCFYYFAKKLFKSKFYATVALLLFSFDFMHFTQTRIATIDSYPVLFIILMYYFMYLFYADSETLSRKKIYLYLTLSGVSFGLAIASKWIGFYGGAGLCILFFAGLIRRVRAKSVKELTICAFCILFFIAIPFIIYYISYIPIHIADGAENYWYNFWNYQKHMFKYHSALEASHPFSSPWYTWPLVLRPIWYYGNKALLSSGSVSSIVGMGNPLIWWASFAAMIALILYAIYLILNKRKAHIPIFICVGYLSQLVPWMGIRRVVFIYHYFASLPFSILALVYVLKKLATRYTWTNKAIYIFVFSSALLFIAFYPILTGVEIPKTYMLSCLKWFESWALGY